MSPDHTFLCSHTDRAMWKEKWSSWEYMCTDHSWRKATHFSKVSLWSCFTLQPRVSGGCRLVVCWERWIKLDSAKYGLPTQHEIHLVLLFYMAITCSLCHTIIFYWSCHEESQFSDFFAIFQDCHTGVSGAQSGKGKSEETHLSGPLHGSMGFPHLIFYCS